MKKTLAEDAARKVASHKTCKMNGIEKKYAAHLDGQKLLGEVLWYGFECISIRLAPRTFYHPDFMVITPSAIEIHETKGHWEDDARVKFKVAADKMPFFTFRAIQRKDNQWVIETI